MVDRARILVVDDDPRLAASVRRALTYEGHEVVVAADGPAALVAARERLPDLVVLDLMLPGIDGVEVCRRLRAASDDVPILMSLTPPALTGILSPLGNCPVGSIAWPVTPEMIHVWTVPGAPQPFGDLEDAWVKDYLASR